VLTTLGEILQTAAAALLDPPWLIPLGVGAGALWWRLRRRLPRAVVLLCVLAGLWLVWTQLSLVDDAFITFRYVHHVLEGHGPVYNPGERVEGITNFGWMLLLAGLSQLLPLTIEHSALLLGLGAYLGLLCALYALERTLDTRADTPPFATALAAVAYPVTGFASSGLESLAATALVTAGTLPLLRARGPGPALLAGALWCAAGWLRMDHLLAWGVGALWVAARRDRRALLAYSATLLPFVALSLWRISYYGDWLPNTYYAKSADQWYFSQGVVYSAVFWLGTRLVLLLPAMGLWIALSRGHERALALWTAGFSVLWQLYVLKVGGDFMVHRFLLPLVPWVLLAAVRTVALLPRPGLAWLGVVLLGCTLRGAPLVADYGIRWGLADEGTVYRVTRLQPLQINHYSFREGQLLRNLLTKRGIRPVIATSGIGMVGYYSELELVDLLGLTDATVAHTEVGRRTRPGHEKSPPPGYLHQRHVLLYRKWGDARWLELTAVRLPGIPAHRWALHLYDKELVDRIRKEAREIRITEFEPWIREVYFPRLAGSTRTQAEQDLHFLDGYYWDINGRDALREELVAKIEALP
jgi:hypothetical protein